MSVGRHAAADLAITIHDDCFFARVLGAGNLGLGESYMDGDWDMQEGDIADFLTALLRSRLDRKVRGNFATAARVIGIQVGICSGVATGRTRRVITTSATTCTSHSSIATG